MLNTEIKYSLSKNYDRLLKLLKNGNMIIGFIAIDIDGKVNNDYSKVTKMVYNSEYKSFNIGFTFFEQDFDKIDFNKLCKKYNVRYFDLNKV